MTDGSIVPRNKTAAAAVARELSYAGFGNPPASEPRTAVGNFFPGLEFNFQNVWKRIFVGIELLESSGQVIAVDLAEVPDDETRKLLMKLCRGTSDPDRRWTYSQLKKSYLIGIEWVRQADQSKHYVDLLRYAHGPEVPSEEAAVTEEFEKTSHYFFLEWANALADVHKSLGGTSDRATCIFLVAELDDTGIERFEVARIALALRSLMVEGTALIDERAVKPGEITESLCSPWQTDYIGCACFYWASNRPDFVNVETHKVGSGDETLALGHHWLNTEREMRTVGGESRPFYTLDRARLLHHEDVMKDWEHKFEFIITGRDRADGVAPPPPPPAPAT